MTTYAEFQQALLAEFPELRPDVESNEGLVHLDVLALGARAQRAKGQADWAVYRRCVGLVERCWASAEPDLRNALAVSFLEHLDFDGPRGPDAWRLLSPTLQAEWQQLTDQMRRVFALPRKAKHRRGKADA
jgi:hypothetical protein